MNSSAMIRKPEWRLTTWDSSEEGWVCLEVCHINDGTTMIRLSPEDQQEIVEALAKEQLARLTARVEQLEAELTEARQGDNLKKLLKERQEVTQQLSQTIYSLRKEVGSLREELAEARWHCSRD